jgi:hypothetical protein
MSVSVRDTIVPSKGYRGPYKLERGREQLIPFY